MKYYFLLGILLFISATAFAADKKVSWDKPNDSAVVGYVIYYGINDVNENKVVVNDPDQTFVEITGLQTGVMYKFGGVSIDTAGNQSDMSNLLHYFVMSKKLTSITLHFEE